MEFGALLSEFQNKFHDFPMRGNKDPKEKIVAVLRYSLQWQRNKHTRDPGKKSLIDIHNISKYHFLQISWSKDINFSMLSHDYARLPDFFYPTGDPTPSIFRSFHQKSYRFSVDIVAFRKLQ